MTFEERLRKLERASKDTNKKICCIQDAQAPDTVPDGSNTQIQFNDSGNFGADANFTWNSTTKVLYVKGRLNLLSTIGGSNTNVAIGDTALANNITGVALVAIGVRAMNAHQTGNSCVAVGRDALRLDVGGGQNTAIGSAAMFNYNGSGNVGNNVAVGTSSLESLVTGLRNIAIGYGAGQCAITSSSDNVYLGTNAGFNASAGVQTGNIIIGANAQTNGASLSNTTVIGQGLSTSLNNVVVLGRGDQNVLIGAPTVNQGGMLSIGAGTTAKAQINLAASVAPTTPNNGDIWFDGTNIKMQVGGVTKTFTLV